VHAFANSSCVLTAGLVAPRAMSPDSSNRGTIRLAAGSYGTLPSSWTKMPNVGVALALTCVVTLGPMAESHRLLTGLVSQIVRSC
jgi:hypothetical protein